VAHAIVAQAGDAGGEVARGEALAAFIAGDQLRVRRPGQDRLGLRLLAGLAALSLDDLDRRQSQRATGGARPLGIDARQRRLGRGPEPADADQRDARGRGLSCRAPGCKSSCAAFAGRRCS
jgi:hypothetical protein